MPGRGRHQIQAAKGPTVVMMFNARVPGDLRYRDVVGDMLRGVCRHVEAVARRDGLETRMISAFNEAFNNVTLHGRLPEEAADVEVRLRVDAARLVLEICDQGPGFDFDSVAVRAAPAFEALDRGGMGLFIIRRAMTHVSYERGRTNRLTMVLDYAAEPATAAPGAGANDEGTQC